MSPLLPRPPPGDNRLSRTCGSPLSRETSLSFYLTPVRAVPFRRGPRRERIPDPTRGFNHRRSRGCGPVPVWEGRLVACGDKVPLTERDTRPVRFSVWGRKKEGEGYQGGVGVRVYELRTNVGPVMGSWTGRFINLGLRPVLAET